MNNRNEKFRITREWVIKQEKKRLTKRDKDLLTIVRRHKLIDRNQLITLAGFSNLKQSIQIINKRLKIMYRLYFLDRAYPHIIPGKGSIPYIYALDKASAYLFDIQPWRRSIRHVKDIEGNIVKKLPINFLHNLFINDVLCTILDICKQNNWHVIYYGVEEENSMKITYNGKSYIIPDIIIIVQNQYSDARIFFIEIDLGNESNKIIKSKINHYNILKAYRTWIQTDWYQNYVQNDTNLIFPHLLFLTGNSSGTRNEMIRKFAKQQGLTNTVLPLYKFPKWFTTIF